MCVWAFYVDSNYNYLHLSFEFDPSEWCISRSRNVNCANFEAKILIVCFVYVSGLTTIRYDFKYWFALTFVFAEKEMVCCVLCTFEILDRLKIWLCFCSFLVQNLKFKQRAMNVSMNVFVLFCERLIDWLIV